MLELLTMLDVLRLSVGAETIRAEVGPLGDSLRIEVRWGESRYEHYWSRVLLAAMQRPEDALLSWMQATRSMRLKEE